MCQRNSSKGITNQNLSALYRGRWTESKQLCYIPLSNNPISKFNINQNLSTEQKQQIDELPADYSDVFFDKLGLRKGITWQQSDKRNTHTWQSLSPAFPNKRNILVSTVELSNSPYSPVISVKKTDKTLCGLQITQWHKPIWCRANADDRRSFWKLRSWQIFHQYWHVKRDTGRCMDSLLGQVHAPLGI